MNLKLKKNWSLTADNFLIIRDPNTRFVFIITVHIYNFKSNLHSITAVIYTRTAWHEINQFLEVA